MISSRKEARDREFSSIQVGDKVSFTRMITQDNVNLFAALTEDFNPLHVDEEYAMHTQFGGRVAHGMLAGSLFSTLVGMHLPGKKCLYLSQTLQFKSPVRMGEEILIHGEVIGKIDALRILVIHTKIINDKKEILIDGEAKVKVLDGEKVQPPFS